MKKSILCVSRLFAAGFGSLALVSVLAGCGMGNLAASGSESTEGVALSGHVHGGDQGVVGSTIQLYAVGTTGYGSNATALLTSAVTSDQNSYWSITGKYTCPSASSQVYIMATGGSPGLGSGATNNAIKLVAALGSCGNLTANTNIDINEVTTVAAAFAMGQYFGTTFAIGLNSANTAGDSFGSPNTTQALLGMTNAVATTARLANFADGTAVTSQTLTGTPGTITTAPESTKIYTIANILASCVNTDGTVGVTTPCGILFGSVAPSGFTAPTNVLEAAVYMSLNPTSNTAASTGTNNSQTNLTNLFALQVPTAPFTGVATQPNDWTVGILYSAPQNATQTLINGVNGINIDASGNVAIINYTSATGAATGISVFGPTGTPLYSSVTFGGINTTTPNALALRQIAVDLNGNACATSSSTGGGLLCLNTGTGATSYFAGSAQYYGIAVDGSNNIFVSHNSTSSNTFSFEEFTGGTISANTQYRFPFDSGTLLNQTATVLTNGNLVETAGSTARSSILVASAINTGTCTVPGPCSTVVPTGGTANDPTLSVTYTTVTLPASTAVYQTAADKTGGFFAPNAATSLLYVNGTTVTAYGSAASLGTSRHVAVDGANTAWVTDRASSGVSQFTIGGAILSPVTTTNGATTTGAVGFVHPGITTAVNGIAIDPSGNVWLPTANQTATAPASNYSMFELVGAAAPTVTPLALALKNSTVGTRP